MKKSKENEKKGHKGKGYSGFPPRNSPLKISCILASEYFLRTMTLGVNLNIFHKNSRISLTFF